mmetsp:Transcript_9840/g.32450  ORF Transcript_9840/g.32450 Transcript_9840/m.32450 type:complete len:209 (+) Transcript_9840:1399-2025(+)
MASRINSAFAGDILSMGASGNSEMIASAVKSPSALTPTEAGRLLLLLTFWSDESKSTAILFTILSSVCRLSYGADTSAFSLTSTSVIMSFKSASSAARNVAAAAASASRKTLASSRSRASASSSRLASRNIISAWSVSVSASRFSAAASLSVSIPSMPDSSPGPSALRRFVRARAEARPAGLKRPAARAAKAQATAARRSLISRAWLH